MNRIGRVEAFTTAATESDVVSVRSGGGERGGVDGVKGQYKPHERYRYHE